MTKVKANAGGAVSATIRNRGGKAAKRSRTAFLLSADPRRGPGDRVLARRSLARLRAGKARTLRANVTIPPGTYRVLACADVRRAVRERSERNNCRPSKAITVAAAPPGPAPSPTPTPSSTPTATPTPRATPPPPPPAPPSVAPRLDDANAATERIGREGGTVSATGADGATYTLAIPAGALISDEDITLTPVGAVDGLPFSGGLAGAVQLAPDGLRLFEPATLIGGAGIGGRRRAAATTRSAATRPRAMSRSRSASGSRTA